MNDRDTDGFHNLRFGRDGDVLVVSHGGVVYALEEACGEPWRRVPNLGARWFDLSDSVLTAGHRVELIADGTIPDIPDVL